MASVSGTSALVTTLFLTIENNYDDDDDYMKIVDHFVNCGIVVNICALDLSKAFDKVNYHAFFIKLMKRFIPVKLLCVSSIES